VSTLKRSPHKKEPNYLSVNKSHENIGMQTSVSQKKVGRVNPSAALPGFRVDLNPAEQSNSKYQVMSTGNQF